MNAAAPKLTLEEPLKTDEVWIKKDMTDIFLNITKVIAPTVKTQARGQQICQEL